MIDRPFFSKPSFFFLLYFFMALAVGTLFQLVVLPFLFPSLHAGEGLMVDGDWLYVHQQAKVIAQNIRAEGWQAWKIDPLVVTMQPQETKMVAFVYALLPLTPLSLTPFLALFHALGAFALLHLVRTLTWLPLKKSFLVTLPFFFFPTTLVWVAQPHKDGIAILGGLLFVLGWMGMSRRSFHAPVSRGYLISIFFDTAWIFLGYSLLFATRPYLCPLLHYLSFFYALLIFLKIVRANQTPWKAGIFFSHTMMLFIVVVSFNSTFSYFQHYRMNEHGKMHFLDLNSIQSSHHALPSLQHKASLKPREADPQKEEGNGEDHPDKNHQGSDGAQKKLETEGTNQSSFKIIPQWENRGMPKRLDAMLYNAAELRNGFINTGGKTNIDTHVYFQNVYDFLSYFPRAVQIALLAPFPSHWLNPKFSGVFRAISAFEMLVCYFGLFFYFFHFKRWVKKIDYLMLNSFCLSMLLAYTYVVVNLGTLTRLRYGYLMPWVSLGLAFFLACPPSLFKRRVSKT